MSFQKKVKALEKAQKLDKGGPTCQLAMQKVCQKNFFLLQIEIFWWNSHEKTQTNVKFKEIYNFVNFGHSTKFLTNLKMADQVEFNDIKRFDEI